MNIFTIKSKGVYVVFLLVMSLILFSLPFVWAPAGVDGDSCSLISVVDNIEIRRDSTSQNEPFLKLTNPTTGTGKRYEIKSTNGGELTISDNTNKQYFP